MRIFTTVSFSVRGNCIIFVYLFICLKLINETNLTDYYRRFRCRKQVQLHTQNRGSSVLQCFIFHISIFNNKAQKNNVVRYFQTITHTFLVRLDIEPLHDFMLFDSHLSDVDTGVLVVRQHAQLNHVSRHTSFQKINSPGNF